MQVADLARGRPLNHSSFDVGIVRMRMRMQETWPKRKPTLSQSCCALKKARRGMMGVSEAVRRDVVRRVELKTMTRTRWGCQESGHPR